MQVQGSRRGAVVCQSDAGCADQNEEQDQESDGATDPRTREPVPDLQKGEKREWRACLPSRTVGCTSHLSSPCRFRDSKQRRRQRGAATGSRVGGSH